MAQRPWEVLKSESITLEQAQIFLNKALRESPSPSLVSLQAALQRIIADKKIANIFAQNKRGVFRKMRCRGLARVLPLHLNHIQTGLKLFLESFQLTFVPEISGVWICARKATLESTAGFSCDSERLGVIVFPFQVEVLTFSPKQGAGLVGYVDQINPQGLTCLVFDSISVNIDLDKLLPGSIPKIDEDNELANKIEVHTPGKDRQIIKIGSKIKFSLARMSSAGGDSENFQIEGTMRAGA